MTSYSRLWATLFLGALTGLSPNAAQSETTVRKSISYFQIGGTTAADLDDELARKGPFTQATGNRHPGATQIRFGGDLTYTKRGTRCAVEDVTVTLETKIILPRWKNRKRASAEMAMIWDALSADIKRHEERHAEIARQHAKLLESRLMKLRPERDCDRLQEKVSAVTDEVTQAHDAAQVRFDRIESRNFQDRMLRILRYRTSKVPN
jgi:predicted secreted Zn-dependent protease